MNNDISYKFNNNVFNYRVSALIKKGDKYLVQKAVGTNYYTFVGGRVSFAETSLEALQREIEEELDIKTKYIRDLGIIENFFNSNFTGEKYHEILITYELAFINNDDYDKKLFNHEGKQDRINYYWLSLDEIDAFEPKILLNHLNDDSFYHIIIRDE